ncbi:MAG: AAA family ATPase [Actinomycetota bacterium]|nr:AAA family ATPase [Actinomycetota bacterium]
MSAERLCLRCRHPLPPEARFCSNCGHPAELPTGSDEQRHRRLASSAPPTVANKIRSSLLKGERRPVTALFADVVGSTAILERLDVEVWTGLLNQAFDLMSQAVYRYEGTIAHLLGDGMLAFFGSPIAHEDDPERAVRAALDMLDLLGPFSSQLGAEEGVDFQIRVGVNTGAVVVGQVGSDLRYEYTAIGDAINVAARIQGLADPGTILVASPTYRFIAPKFETRYVGPLTLKGKADPVVAYQVLGVKTVPEPTRGLPGLTSELVGRAQPLAELEHLLESVIADGRGAAVLIDGEPGIGKSRLVQELRLRNGERGRAAWAEGRCLSFGRGMPYHLLLDLLRSMLGLTEFTHQTEVERVLTSSLDGLDPDDRPEVHRYVARLLGLPLSPADSEAIQHLAEEARHERLLASLNRFLAHIANTRPHVLICEDLHWADRSSMEALERVLDLVRRLPLLLVLTSRPEPDAPVDELADAAARVLGESLRRLSLEPLSEEESRSMVAQLLEIESLPPRTRELILQKSEGNPLFVEEIIRMLMEQKAIVRAGDKWISNQGAQSDELPTTLHGLLLARVDRLPEHPKWLARVASVIGRQFDLSTLSEVVKATDGHIEVEHSLHVLESFGLISSQDGQGGPYSFRHALIEDAVYDSILHRDKTRLHAAVADVLERLHASRLDEWAAVLSLHTERAGDLDRAVDYLIRAGQNALQRFAPKEAYDLFGRALQHLSSMPDEPKNLRKRLLARLGENEAGLTFVPGREQLAGLEASLEDAEKLGDLNLLAEVHVAIAEARHELGEMPAVSPALARSVETAERIAETLDDERLRAFPFALRGYSHFAASEFRKAVEVLQQAVPLLERHSSLTKAAYYAGMAAISAARLGEFALADGWIRQADALAQRSQDPSAVMDVDLHRGIVEGERGNITEALAFAKRGTEIAVKIDNKACALVGYFIMGDQQLRMGLTDEALRSLERSTQIAEFCNVADIENLSRAWLSAVRAQLGEDEGVLSRLDESLARAREMGNRLNEGEILRQRAIVRARMSAQDWDAVRADFEAAIAIFERIEVRPYVARALRDYGITLQAGHRIAEGQEKLRRAFEQFESMRMQLEDGPVSRS